MYRKLLLAASFALVSMSMVAQEAETQDTLGIHPFKDTDVYSSELTNWSIYIDAGFSHFDGDNGVKLSTADQMSFDGGLGLNYQFTPMWSWFLDWHTTSYGQHMFDRSLEYNELIQNGGKSLGHMHTISTGIGFNLMNAFFPKRQHNLFNLYLLAGGGVAAYSYHGSGYNYTFDNKGAVKTMDPVYDAYTNGKGKWIAEGEEGFNKWNAIGFVTGGILAEFNVSRVFSLGLRAYYDYFLNDYPDGGTSIQNKNNKNNDGLFACDLEMRFNILAKSKSHMRNISNMESFYGELADETAKKASQKDTLYIITRDTTLMMRETGTSSVITNNNTYVYNSEDNYYYVYFDNDKTNLKDEGLATIQQVASRLARDSSLYAVIIGYCDNTGSNDYNLRLAQQRAAKVTDELYVEHGTPQDRMFTVAKGILVGKRSQNAYSPNRRTEIRLVNREWYDKLKNEYHNDVVNTKQILPSVQLKDKALEVEVKERTSLSKLARRYYNNTFCWIYIYEANRDLLPNPNDLPVGTKLIIPVLTEKQKQITLEESKAKFASFNK